MTPLVSSGTTRPRGAPRIGILGHVGNGNLGDEAIIAAVIESIRRRVPAADICCFTSNPADTRARHGVPSFPLRRATGRSETVGTAAGEMARRALPSGALAVLQLLQRAAKRVPAVSAAGRAARRAWRAGVASAREPAFVLGAYRQLKGMDLLLVAGSQQLIDYVPGKAWGHPYTLFKWTALARSRRTRIAFVSCGAGPITTRLGKYFIRRALTAADFRSYRDESSRACVESIGAPKNDRVVPDLVFGLSGGCTPEAPDPAERERVVAINPVPFVDPSYWVGASRRNYESFVSSLGEFAIWLGGRGYTVFFFPTQLRADPPVIDDLKRYLQDAENSGRSRPKLLEVPVCSHETLMRALSMADFVVATRFHGVVLSYLLGKPAVGIAYADKTRALMEQMGQGDLALDLLDLEPAALADRIEYLEALGAASARDLQQRLTVQRSALEAQYDEIFRLLAVR